MKKDTKRLLYWLLAAVAIIGGFLWIMFASGSDGAGGEISLTEVQPDEWIKGTPGAQLTLIEYSDFQCPACASRVDEVKKAAQEFGNHIQIVYRHFPLNQHKNAPLAARASEAAGIQGKFWEMHDLIFENQITWSSMSQSEAKDAFTGYANLLGLDMDQFEDDISSSEVQRAVDEDLLSGNEIPVRATPSFYLDGEPISFSDYESLRDIIRNNLDQ